MTGGAVPMSDMVIPAKAKFFVSIIYSSDDILSDLEKRLIKKFGIIDYRTRSFPYVSGEFFRDKGPAQHRVFLSFVKLMKRERIVSVKKYTTGLEQRFMKQERQGAKIDPGYLTLSNVFIATGRDYFHRAYIGKGVYLENEYRYVGKRYQPWEWTPPDLHKPENVFFFHEIRVLYQRQLGE